MPTKIFLTVFLLAHLVYTFRVQKKISSNQLLSKIQKVVHSIFIWLIPFVWYYLIKGFMTVDAGPITITQREELNKERNNGFYESGLGG